MKSTRFCFCSRRSGNSYWILQWWPMGKYILNTNTIDPKTRMHSSRMRTGHSLAVYWGSVCFQGGICFWGSICLQEEGVCLLGGVCLWGSVCFWGMSASGGCLLLGGCMPLRDVCFQAACISQHAMGQTPPPHPCGQNHRRELKHNLGHNFIVAGNNTTQFYFISGRVELHWKISG